MRPRILAICFVLALAALGGCVSPAQRPGRTVPLPADLHALENWQASGRIGVTGASSGGSGSFEWQQHGNKADVKIRGPVGIGSVRLQVEGEAGDPQLKLQTGDGKTLESQAAWDELESRLGAPVPAGNLRFWMLGIAAPGEHTWHDPSSDGVTTLEQDGWRIDYQNYSDAPGAHVPMKIRASSGTARVRIVVDGWRLGQ
ncbi:MAG TPA: lipoprotein insertase outer membrane protein LolB [Steroidobacteraceae bacterium]|jgi:outer membrane lipoprotein LolB